MRRIVIEEEGEPRPSPPAPASPRFDLQDVLLVLGIVFAEAAAAVIWWPSALVLASGLCLGFAWLIERNRKG